MTDKELLELAAKAVGIDLSDATFDAWGDVIQSEWNPLIDDGEALRLAVNLELTLDAPFDRTIAMVWTNDITNFTGSAKKEGNIYAATRRAIVKAAANIGKNMK